MRPVRKGIFAEFHCAVCHTTETIRVYFNYKLNDRDNKMTADLTINAWVKDQGWTWEYLGDGVERHFCKKCSEVREKNATV